MSFVSICSFISVVAFVLLRSSVSVFGSVVSTLLFVITWVSVVGLASSVNGTGLAVLEPRGEEEGWTCIGRRGLGDTANEERGVEVVKGGKG